MRQIERAMLAHGLMAAVADILVHALVMDHAAPEPEPAPDAPEPARDEYRGADEAARPEAEPAYSREFDRGMRHAFDHQERDREMYHRGRAEMEHQQARRVSAVQLAISALGGGRNADEVVTAAATIEQFLIGGGGAANGARAERPLDQSLRG